MHKAIESIYAYMGEARPFPYVESGVCVFASQPHAGFVYIRPLDEREAEIIYIGVLHEYRRQGLARQLIQDLQKKHRKLYLEVETTNQPAYLLYASLGFATQRMRPHYYGPNRDALDMVWSV